MKVSKYIIVSVLTFLLVGCSTGYKNDGDAVYYNSWNEGSGQHKDKLDADPETFKVLAFDNYAKDNNTVFYQGEKITGADAATFEALGDFYARDKNFGWYGKDTIRQSRGRSFSIINDYYSTDGNDVFYMTMPLNMASPANFKFVNGDGEDESWTTDGKFYYYENYKVPSNDYKNLTIYPKSGGLSSDRQYAYFLDHKLNYDIDGNRVIDTIDMATFKVSGYIECSDKYGRINVYHGRMKRDEQ